MLQPTSFNSSFSALELSWEFLSWLPRFYIAKEIAPEFGEILSSSDIKSARPCRENRATNGLSLARRLVPNALHADLVANNNAILQPPG